MCVHVTATRALVPRYAYEGQRTISTLSSRPLFYFLCQELFWIAQASLEISFFLPTAPECSDHRYVAAPHQPSKSELYKPNCVKTLCLRDKGTQDTKGSDCRVPFPVILSGCPGGHFCYATSSSVICCTPEDAVKPECHSLPYRLQKRWKVNTRLVEC